MQTRLRPKREALRRCEAALSSFKIQRRCRTVHVRFICRPPSSRLVHHVNRVPLSQEELSPALSTVRRSREIRSRLIAAMNHDDRPTLSLLARNLELGIELTG